MTRTRPALIAAALAAALSAGPAAAQGPAPAPPAPIPRVAPQSLAPQAVAPQAIAPQAGEPRDGDVRGACREGSCYMLRVTRVQPVDDSNLGRLLFVKARTWKQPEAQGAPEEDVGTEEGFAFCSARAPALVTVDGERVRVTWLAPQSPAEAASSRSPYVLYFEACHGAGRSAAADVVATADRLGYEVARRRRETVEAGQPQDVLALAEDVPGPRRQDRAPSPRLYGWPGYAR